MRIIFEPLFIRLVGLITNCPDELYPAGWFPNQHAGGDGLPKWTEANRSIDSKHLVVWYTLNYHHLPRPEDWPVQPVVYADFHWMPDGFFDENPTMDLA